MGVLDEIPGWTLDPDDPRAPTREVWERLTSEQRDAVVASLPSSFPIELYPPEGETHDDASRGARDSLRRQLNPQGAERGTYIAADLPVYYPGERMISPDLMAVRDVPLGKRETWVVQKEGKGLELALEVVVGGDRKKDLVRNPEKYARLGIGEYYVYDIPRGALRAWHLAAPDDTVYTPRIPQVGRFYSEVLGLDLLLEDGELRFYQGSARVPTNPEFVAHLSALVEDANRRAEEEAHRADEAEAEVRRLRVEIEALRAETSDT